MKCDNISTFIKSQQGSFANSRLDNVVKRVKSEIISRKVFDITNGYRISRESDNLISDINCSLTGVASFSNL